MSELLRPLPKLPPQLRLQVLSRKVEKLSCIRFASARYSVPCRLIGGQVTITTAGGLLTVIQPVTGEVLAEHTLVGPGEVSIDDAHYDKSRPDKPSRTPRPRTQAEKNFCALGPDADAFLVGSAAAGVSKLGGELVDILALGQDVNAGLEVAARRRHAFVDSPVTGNRNRR